MKILIIGGSGQLGRCLQDRIPSDWIVAAPTSAEANLTDHAQLKALFNAHWSEPFDVVVNASAYNAVDAAEADPAGAFAVNSDGPAELARLANAMGARFFHVSTDYVFSGKLGRPYTEDDKADPLGVYGKSKRAGEQAVLMADPDAIVIRTSWLYSEYGRNFVKTMLGLAAQGRSLTVVDDQVGTPTYAGDLADVIIGLASRSAVPGGIYHYAGADVMSWFELAGAALDGLPHELKPTDSAGYPTVAPRPQYSVLLCKKLEALGFAPRPQAPNLAHVRRLCSAA